MSNIDTREAVARFAGAVGNLSAELLGAGVEPAALAAGLRIEAGKIEAQGRQRSMTADERELLEVAAKAHEFINTLQIAGIEERVATTCLVNTGIERMVRLHGPAKASRWLRGLADFVDRNGPAFEETGKHH
nr:hypothetical protein [Sphingomonas sp. Y57]